MQNKNYDCRGEKFSFGRILSVFKLNTFLLSLCDVLVLERRLLWGGWQQNNGKNCAKLLGCRSTRSWLASRREGNCLDLEREREVAKNEECEKSRGCNENCMIQDGAKINTFHVYHAPSTLLQAARLLVLKSSISLFTCLVSWKNSLFTVNPFSDSFHRNFSRVKHITLPRNHFLIKFITFLASTTLHVVAKLDLIQWKFTPNAFTGHLAASSP